MADSRATGIKKYGKSVVSVMVTAKATPKNWSEETNLFRMTEENGINTVFVVTGEALTCFKGCETWKIFDVEILGKCVKMSDGFTKYGIENTREVRLKFRVQISLSKKSWPVSQQYKFVSWDALNQKGNKDWFDLLGRAAQTPSLDVNSDFPKMTVLLENGGMQQKIDFLGDHASIIIEKGDKVCIGAARVNEWRQVRTIQTTYLTVIEINPIPRDGVNMALEDSGDGPKQKAMRMSVQTQISVNGVLGMMEKAKQEVGPDPKESVGQDVEISGKIGPLTAKFFETAPVVGDIKEKMCIQTVLTDPTGEVDIKLWDDACFELFQMTAPVLKKKWEDAMEETDEQDGLLKELNEHLRNKVRVMCTVKIWSYGFKTKTHVPQLHVNAVECVAADE